jgi:hypothetical protein
MRPGPASICPIRHQSRHWGWHWEVDIYAHWHTISQYRWVQSHGGTWEEEGCRSLIVQHHPVDEVWRSQQLPASRVPAGSSRTGHAADIMYNRETVEVGAPAHSL